MIRLISYVASHPPGAAADVPLFIYVFPEPLIMGRAAAVIFALLFLCGIAAALAHTVA
jgi:hypothetical protein